MTDERTTNDALGDRVLIGHCPDCERVLVVFNDYGSWPLVRCSCGWTDATTAVKHWALYSRGGVVTLPNN